MTPYFSIGLRGAGSRHVESLSSYLGRLAFEHRVTVRDFLRDLGGRLPVRAAHAKAPGRFVTRDGRTLVGATPYVRRLVPHLEALTGSPDLSAGTLIFLAAQIAQTGEETIKITRHWCPECYRESESTECYDQLLWQLDGVLLCDLHGSPLQNTCPSCKMTQPFISWPTHRRRCASCATDLSRRPILETPLTQPQIGWDTWCRGQLGQLVEANQFERTLASVRPNQFHRFLVRFQETHDLGVAETLDALGLCGYSNHYLHPGSRPRLRRCLVAAATARVTLSEIFFAPDEAASAALPERIDELLSCRLHVLRQKQRQQVVADVARFRLFIENDRSSPPLSLGHACKEAGVRLKVVQYHAQDLVLLVRKRREESHVRLRRAALVRARKTLPKIVGSAPISGQAWELSRRLAKAAGDSGS